MKSEFFTFNYWIFVNNCFQNFIFRYLYTFTNSWHYYKLMSFTSYLLTLTFSYIVYKKGIFPDDGILPWPTFMHTLDQICDMLEVVWNTIWPSPFRRWTTYLSLFIWTLNSEQRMNVSLFMQISLKYVVIFDNRAFALSQFNSKIICFYIKILKELFPLWLALWSEQWKEQKFWVYIFLQFVDIWTL